ncbi:hypothetical protein [Plantactinospora sp. B5E13]|uniref:hypothetical protein n=1 Tax=Plantactinospora sp. B5E13 TaxID=3153758 RepID=UPI00325D649F
MGDKQYFESMSPAGLALTRGMGRFQRPNSRGDQEAWRDLQVGLATAASMQASIRHADAKALALLTAEGGVAATAGNQVLPTMLDSNLVVATLTVLLATTMVIAMTASTWQLALALQPRLAGAGRVNRFGFPNLVAAARRPSIVAARRYRDEAWDFVVALASIAMAKHLRIRQCMPWFLMSLGSAVGLVILRTVGGVTA